jgi:hypothetical protein
VIGAPPSEITFPPQVKTVADIEVGALVVTTGGDAEYVVNVSILEDKALVPSALIA